MIVVMNRITVAEGREREFEEAFLTRDRAVDQMAGFIDLHVLRPTEGRTYVVMTRWNSREAFDNWTTSEAFRAAHKKGAPAPQEDRPVLEIYEVLSQ
jgi:heme-degrading monooxygenase HmoA